MFSDLNINDHIWHMKREIFNGVLFIGFMFGVNYLIKTFLNEMSDESSNDNNKKEDEKQELSNQDDLQNAIKQQNYDIIMEDFNQSTMNNLDDMDLKYLQNSLQLTYDEDNEEINSGNDKVEEEMDDEGDNGDNGDNEEINSGNDKVKEEMDDKKEDVKDDIDQDTLNLLDEVKYVLDTKIKDDIMVVQNILEKKQYLIGLNKRLMEIRDRLQELKNELS
jgi:hypothetical protein